MKPHQICHTLLVCMAILIGGIMFATSCSSPKPENTAEKKPTTDKSQQAPPSEKKPKQPQVGPDKTDDNGHSEATDSKKKLREPIFEGWAKPTVALFITGRQHGYIEPCGCTGLANQKGGLSRRQTLMRELEDKGWPLVALDVGNQVRRFGRQPIIKFETTKEGLYAMNYAAIGFGPDDLRLPSTDLLRIIYNPESPSSFVSANVVVIDDSIVKPFWILETAGKKIGVTSILGQGMQTNLGGDDIKLKSPEDGLNDVWPLMKKESCDLYVLLAHASLEESRELAQKFPDFDLVVTAGGAGEPTLEPEKIANSKAQMIQVGTKGMYVGVVGLFDDKEKPIRYQRVPLDDRFGDSKDMLDLLRKYQEQLETAGFDGLSLEPQPHPSGRKFVGSEACKECHEDAYKIWKEGLEGLPAYHAHATESIVKPPNSRGDIPRHHDPECISCHVTGWNPQKYYPYVSGYLDLKKSVLLHGNGCENCHGPGSEHIVEETTETITRSTAESCLDCHDLDNSPAFKFETYWPRIKH